MGCEVLNGLVFLWAASRFRRLRRCGSIVVRPRRRMRPLRRPRAVATSPWHRFRNRYQVTSNIWWLMRTEIQNIVDQIKQSLGLLRRHL
jgi:hypothetical protein